MATERPLVSNDGQSLQVETLAINLAAGLSGLKRTWRIQVSQR